MKINRASNLHTCYLQGIFIKTVVEHEMLQVTSVFLLVKKPTVPPIHQPISRYPNTRKAWWWSYIVIAIFVFGITLPTWNLKHPLKNGCFHWMSPNLCMKNGCYFHQTSTKNWLFGIPGTFQFESSTRPRKKLDTVFFRDSFLELYDDFGGTKVCIHAKQTWRVTSNPFWDRTSYLKYPHYTRVLRSFLQLPILNISDHSHYPLCNYNELLSPVIGFVASYS